MALKVEDIKIKGYERIIHATNKTTKLDCVIAIHNTKLGPALGGVRSWEYKNFEDQKTVHWFDYIAKNGSDGKSLSGNSYNVRYGTNV